MAHVLVSLQPVPGFHYTWDYKFTIHMGWDSLQAYDVASMCQGTKPPSGPRLLQSPVSGHKSTRGLGRPCPAHVRFDEVKNLKKMVEGQLQPRGGKVQA